MADVQAFEKWFEARFADPRERELNRWLLEAVRAHRRWGQGREVSAAEFDQAVEEVSGLKLGGGPPAETIDTQQR